MNNFLRIFDYLIPEPITFSYSLKDFRKGKAGRWWDTWIGREGIIGHGGEMLNLWDSGTTVDHKNRAISTVAGQKDKWRERSQAFTGRAMDQFAGDMRTDSRKVGGLIQNVGNTNLATDNSRNLAINRLIADSVSARNMKFDKTMGEVKDRQDAYDDKIFEATRAQETIRDA